jgi:dipeptidase E
VVGAHIVALGGGGFSMEESPALDDYILSLAEKARPKVCFIPTASGDALEYVKRFYDVFPPTRCEPSHLGLFSRTVADLRKVVLAQDVVYVGGGNTANLLAIWRAHGMDKVIREAWEVGVVIAGVSAGAMCWFQTGVTDSFGPGLSALRNGLAFLPGSFCPHYDGEPERRGAFQRFVAEGLPEGYAVEDGVGLHFVGVNLVNVISSRPPAKAYRVEKSGGKVVERPIPTQVLK